MADAKITFEQVLHVAKLARLTLSDEEARQMQEQLDAILGYMPERCSDRSEILEQAPESESGGFAVPLVLEVE
jgi:Asp-tRNA(Asn)/Glu-tRNA(Gln) amidotransferase C subunit